MNAEYGGQIIINRGTVTAQGGANGAGIGGRDRNRVRVIINGGEVVATGGANGAGIGGCSRSSIHEITINNGIVNATGGTGAAGIGGGYCAGGGTITINDGEVTATGGSPEDMSTGGGAGIGSGAVGINQGSPVTGGTITINGGTVNASGRGFDMIFESFAGGAGIGGGYNCHGGIINITGGNITANGGGYAAGIGGGHKGNSGIITISGGYITATEYGIGPGNEASWGDGENYTDLTYADEYTDMSIRVSKMYGRVNFKKAFRTDSGKTIGPEDSYNWSIRPCIENTTLIPDTFHNINVKYNRFAGYTYVSRSSAPVGAEVTVQAMLNDKEPQTYRLIGFKVTGTEYEDLGNFCIRFTMPDNDVTVETLYEELYYVRFDTGGGTTVDPQIVEKNAKVVKPEDPSMEGYIFKAWRIYGSPKDYDFDTPVTGDLTLKAYWVRAHTIELEQNNPEDGTVTFDRSEAATDDTVTITVAPNGARSPDDAIVKSAGDGTIYVTVPLKGRDGVFTGTFVMPSDDVVVSVNFQGAGGGPDDEKGDVSPKAGGTQTPDTGDNSQPLVFILIALAGVALAGIAGAAAVKRRKKM